jgi:hypothetical protein
MSLALCSRTRLRTSRAAMLVSRNTRTKSRPAVFYRNMSLVRHAGALAGVHVRETPHQQRMKVVKPDGLPINVAASRECREASDGRNALSHGHWNAPARARRWPRGEACTMQGARPDQVRRRAGRAMLSDSSLPVSCATAISFRCRGAGGLLPAGQPSRCRRRSPSASSV